MSNFTPAATPTCQICSAPLFPNQARTDRLCGRGQCGLRYASLQRQKKVCVVCGRLLSARELPTQICATPDCQRIALRDYARRVYERNQARSEALIQREIEQATRLRDRVMDDFGFKEPESFRLVVIPAFTAKLANLPARRWRNFRDHLTSLIGQAVIPPEMPPSQDRSRAIPSGPDPTPEAQAVMRMACSCCKGLCCEGGADHAYLKVETIRRCMAEHPEQRPRDVLAAYLDRVGHRTYEGSCIFHQSNGCALTRDMRADLCNRHYCKALQELQQNLPTEAPIRAFFVSAHYGAIRAAALVHENHMLTIQGAPLQTPAPADE